MPETVRDSISRAMGVDRSQLDHTDQFIDRGETGWEPREDIQEGHGPTERAVIETVVQREHHAAARRSPGRNAAESARNVRSPEAQRRQRELDRDRQRQAFDQVGLGQRWRNAVMDMDKAPAERRENPDAMPKLTVREAAQAALAEVKIEKREVTDYDPLTKRFIEQPVAAPNSYGMPDNEHWNGIHRDEFIGMPPKVQEIVQRASPIVKNTEAWMQAFRNPQTAGAATNQVLQIYPLNDEQKIELATWYRDRNRRVPQRPQVQGIPFGIDPGEWASLTNEARAALRKNAEHVLMAQEFERLAQNPQTRVEAFKHLGSSFPIPGAEQAAMLIEQQSFAALPPEGQMQVQAEHTVSNWSRDKPHFKSRVSDGKGGSMPVHQIMAEMIQYDMEQVNRGQQQVFGTFGGTPLENLERTYQFITSQPNFAKLAVSGTIGGLVREGRSEKKRAASSMTGGAPWGPSAPAPQDWESNKNDTARQSIAKAFMELRNA